MSTEPLLTAGPLLGKSPMAYDSVLSLPVEVFPCEDSHAQERSFIPKREVCNEDNIQVWIEGMGSLQLWDSTERRIFPVQGLPDSDIVGVARCWELAFVVDREYRGFA